MTAPVLLTDDLTRQVHVVPQRLTKECPRQFGVGQPSGTRCRLCGGCGEVPVEVGATLELRQACAFADSGVPPCVMAGDQRPSIRCEGCDGSGYRSRSAPVAWEGPAARVIRCGAKHNAYMRPYVAQAIGGHPLLLHAIDYDALGIGSDPDQWVYLVGEAT